MSFWKWAIPIGAAAAIPFTGGLSALGLGGASAGAAGMSASTALALGSGAATGIAGLYGAHKQAQSSDQALAFAKEQYAAEEARRAPYREAASAYLNWRKQGAPMQAPPAFQPQTLRSMYRG